MLATFFEARQEYDHALLTYGRHFLVGVLLLSAICPLLLLQPPPRYALGRRFLPVPVAALVLTSAAVGMFTGRLEELPPTVDVPVKAIFAVNESSVYTGPRDAVIYSGAIQPRFEKVVFIVDEAIRGDYMQINDAAFDNTPFLASTRRSFGDPDQGRATDLHVGPRPGEVLPTLLWAMGFEPMLTTPPYASSLPNTPARASRRFFVFSPFQKDVQWVTVD